jgi:hypothetical protein
VIGLAWLAGSAVAACPDPPAVSYDGRTFRATFCAHGGHWAGATLRSASDGQQYDLPAVEVEGDTVTVTGDVGPGYVQYVLGTWNAKSPCSAGRHGCTAYGYELDENEWSFPSGAYEWGYESAFADLRPARVQVLDAGGGAALAAKVRGALPGLGMPVLDGGAAAHPRGEIQVLYRARWDRPRAWRIAAALRDAELGYRWTVTQWAEAPEAFVVAVGGAQ